MSQFGNNKLDSFFEKMDDNGLAITYGDVRLKTGYSEILPDKVNPAGKFSRNLSPLHLPIISAPMDTVTESAMAIAMAKNGGLGIIHRALNPEQQAKEVVKVKYHLNAFIPDPIKVREGQTVGEVLELAEKKGFKFRSFPVVKNSGVITGIVSQNDFDFCHNKEKKIKDIMTTDIIMAEDGTTTEQAYEIMTKNHKKILPIFDKDKNFKGIYTFADVNRILHSKISQRYSLDKNGRLLVGAAIGVKIDDLEIRLEKLTKAKVDVVVIDTAHGDSKGVIETLQWCKKHYPELDVVAGNITEGASAQRLIDAGADGLRVGQGGGSICTTRVIAGIGCPQVTAIYNCSKVARVDNIPVCADGGIELSGDIPIALAMADSVMIGKMLAGTNESPGEVLGSQGKQVKIYRGMGSKEAMEENIASRERYHQTDKLVPEGVTGEVVYEGKVDKILEQLNGGLLAGMGYVGAANLGELHDKADFYLLTSSGQRENYPHGLNNIKEAPNYKGGSK